MANLTKSKKWVILAIAIILMPFVENILGIRQLLTAYAEDVVSGEMLVKDPDGRVTVEKSDEHEADGNMVWTLTVHKENAENETSKVKVSLADETVVQGGTIAGDGFQASGSTLVENDYTNDKRVLTVTAPVGVTANLTVDYDLRQDIMPASKMDGEEGEEGEEDPDQPATEITENVMATGQSGVGNVQLDTPDEVLQAIADAEAAAQAEAEAKAAAEAAAQAAAEEKAAAEAEEKAAANAAAEEADRLVAEEKAAAEAATAQVEADAEVESEADAQAEVDDQKDIEDVDSENVGGEEISSEKSGIDTSSEDSEGESEKIVGKTFMASKMALAGDSILRSAAGSQSSEGDVEIIKSTKSAKLTDWENRLYEIDINVETKGDIGSGPARVIMVADVSGSMEGTNLTTLKATAKNFVTQLQGTGSSVAVVSYANTAKAITTSSSTVVEFNNTNQTNATNADFESIETEAQLTSLNGKIDGLSANGATRSDFGLGLAYHSIKAEIAANPSDTRPFYVIFLSDGVPTTQSSFDEDVARRAEQWASMIKGNKKTVTKYGFSDLSKGVQQGWSWNWESVEPESITDDLSVMLTIAANQHTTTNNDIYYQHSDGTVYRFKATATSETIVVNVPQTNRNLLSNRGNNPGNAFAVKENVTITDNRPLLECNPFVYAIQQASSMTNQVETFMTNVATSSEYVFNASNKEKLDAIFAGILKQIKNAGVVDVVDKRFELDMTEEELKALGISATVNSDGTTTLTWNTQADKTTGIMTINSTIKIKAKDDYIGENVVPTNVPDNSGLFVDGERVGFNIVDSEGATVAGLTTPYVNVKLLPFSLVDTEETIWLGEEAKSQSGIYKDWQDTTKGASIPEETYGVSYPTISFEDLEETGMLSGYESMPLEDKQYQEKATAVAGDATMSEGKLEQSYAENTGLGGIEAGKGVTNTASHEKVTHDVKVRKDNVNFNKLLNGEEITHEYKASFTVIQPSTPEKYPAATVDFARAANNQSYDLKLSDLGIGTYTITETTPDGVKNPGTWTLNVTKGGEASNPNSKLIFTLKKGEDVVTELNNEWNDFVIQIQKQNDYGEALDGAEFTLYKGNQEVGKFSTLPDKLSEFTIGELKPGTYSIQETVTPDGYIGLDGRIEIVIKNDGTITVNDQANLILTDKKQWVVKGDNNIISIIATNQAKGVLPATGGSGRQMVSFVILLMTMCLAGVGVIYVAYTRKGGV